MSFVFLQGSGGVRKPVLFTPLLSIDYNTSVMTISDGNGDFAHYEVYAEENGIYVLKTTTTIKSIDLTTLFPTHNEDINIKVKAIRTNFVGSDFSNVIVWQYGLGTEGLAYTLSQDNKYYICSGIGSSIATEIVIGSVHDGLPVTKIKSSAFYQTNITSVIMPDSIEVSNEFAFAWDYNGNFSPLRMVVFGKGINYVGKSQLNWNRNCKVIFLCNNVPQLPYVLYANSDNIRIYVPNLIISQWKNATNWAQHAGAIFPLVETVSDIANIDTTIYTKACVIGNDFAEYTYNGSDWEVVQ